MVGGEDVLHLRQRVVSRRPVEDHSGEGSRGARRRHIGGVRHDQGARDRPIVGVQHPNGDEMTVGHVDGLHDPGALERDDGSLHERHGVSRFVRWRRASELQPVGAGGGRRDGVRPVRVGADPVNGLGQRVRMAEQVQIRLERARMRSQDDLDAGGGSVAVVDEGAGDGVGRLGREGAGGERGDAGEPETRQWLAHSRGQPHLEEQHSGLLRWRVASKRGGSCAAASASLFRRGHVAVAASNAAAMASVMRSLPLGVTICRPTGRPDGPIPQGTEMAGQPVTVIEKQEAIQSV